MQRFELLQKGIHPDVLVMTATPIPRTLALTLYGDLDVSVIDELPPGRRPIITRHVTADHAEQVYSFLKKQIDEGRQAYVVYPVIDESETSAMKAATKMYEHLSQEVFPGVAVGLMHGRLPADEKESAMSRFKQGEIQILVSTTVIEVGVDVPNATVMVIEQAERFGLAQLHQLRGRVGRGAAQSYCVLITERMSDAARERIRTLVDSNDGFLIAEMDLKLRGPGEFFGTKQSGLPTLRVANILRDQEILEAARREALDFVSHPPSEEELRRAVAYIRDHWQRRYGRDTRPTPDRLRETLFDILASRISGAVFLDAYAGTGAVGIEALSRGAARCVFLEQSRAAVEVIRENLHTLSIEARATVVAGKVAAALGRYPADIVFLDPPYEKETEYGAALEKAQTPLVIVQHSFHFDPGDTLRGFGRTRQVRQGDNVLSFYSGANL